MKAKEYIIQKLVNLGKKHHWMKYPMLALVSLISLFFLLLEKCMERPKRAVVALVCLVLIISQSWYLISLANTESDPDASLQQMAEGLPPVSGESSDTAASGDTTAADGTALQTTATEMQIEQMQTNQQYRLAASETYTITIQLGKYGKHNGDTGSYQKVLQREDLESGYQLSTLASEITSSDTCFKQAGWSYSDGGALLEKTQLTLDDFTGNKNITLYVIWQLQSYRVHFDPGDGGSGDSTQQTVQIQGGEAPKVTLSNQSFTKKGYAFTEWRINGDNNKRCKAGEQYTITEQGPDVYVTPYWVPITYHVAFEKGSEGSEENVTGEMPQMDVAYDQTVRLDVCTFQKPGYTFAGWKGENEEHYDDAAEIQNLKEQEGETFTMTAQWTYQAASLSKSNIEAQYSDAVEETIDIYHSVTDIGQFTPTLVAVTGHTVDGDVSLKDYKEITGLSVQVEQNKITITADSVQTVSDGALDLTFSVHDEQNSKEPNTSLHVMVNLQPKTLTVTGVQYKTKMYDGDTQIPIGSIYYTDGVKNNQEITEISVYNEGQTGTFDNANAGTGKPITISGLHITGNRAKYYTIDPTAVVPDGEITKKQVRVTTAPVYEEGKDHILTGQEPAFTVTVNRDDLPAIVAEADEPIIKNAITGHFTCDYGAPDYLAGDHYTIGIDVEQVQLDNYYLQVTTGKLVVKQENPILDTDYTIIGTISADGWYYGNAPRIETKGGSNYDRVYLMDSQSNKAATYEVGLFSNSAEITEEMARGDVYLQLANSTNHAVTALKKIEIKIDITAPTIDKENIVIDTVNGSGLKKVGNILSFGNFFREELRITIPVADLRYDGSKPGSDEVSGVKDLTYYLGGYPDGTAKTIEVKDGKASFTVPMNFKGEIAFITSDKAGNVSSSATLIGVNGVTSEYWVIENTAPVVKVTAVNEEGATAFAGEGNYYKTVKVTADVTDDDAGVAYVLWNITKNGEPIAIDEKETVADTNKQVMQQAFTKTFTESGTYTVKVTAYDNADNVSLEMQPIEFVVDGTAPVVTVSPDNYDAVWETSKTITLTVTDAESGVDMLTAKDEHGNRIDCLEVAGEPNTYTITVTKKGTYTIKAVDYAGNVTEYPVVFTRVSAEVPDNPVVTITPDAPGNTETYWYQENPLITIEEPSETPDGTQIFTYYHLWKDGTDEPTHDNQRAGDAFRLPGEGVWNLRVWAETESGMQNQYGSDEDGLYQIRYDGTAPLISDVVLNGDGTNTKITFKVTEAVSGLAKVEAVYNNNEAYAKQLDVTYIGDGVYTAEFTAAMRGSYDIKATDRAGNVGTADAFEPMNITITSINGNAKNGITVLGQVTAGTFEIDHISVSYGPEGSTDLTNADSLTVTKDSQGNQAFTAKFTNLKDDTRYRFEVLALSTDGERCDYIGAFQTEPATPAGINVAGTVTDEAAEAGDDSTISVMLYQNQAVLQSRNVNSGESFIFTNVPDGIYTIRAVKGSRSVSAGIVITNSVIVEPSTAIQLVLRAGHATDVEYKDETLPEFHISGLNDLFDDTTNFNSQDNDIINAGGTVEFCMEVSALSEAEVPVNDLAGIQNNLMQNEHVAMYLDFSIWKRAIGAYGLISETEVLAINGGKTIRIVIPLSSDLAAKESLSVIRVHGSSVERLVDLDTNPNTYTIESALFSTYALVYSDAADPNGTQTPGGAAGDNGNDPNGTGGGNGNGAASTSDISQTSRSTATLTSSSGSSPKTGDASPVVWVAVCGTLMSIGGVFLLKNKKRQ